MADERIPNNHVIAVINGSDAAAQAAGELERLGFSQTHLFTGEEAKLAIDSKGENSGFATRILRAAQDHLSEETNYLAQYEEEARNGNDVLAVKVESQDQAREVKDLLEKHGARNVRYFGTLAVEDLTPETNPSARSQESPERWSNV
jgi:hypothetical protein